MFEHAGQIARDVVRGGPDPRHQPLMIELARLYRAYNNDLDPPDMGRTARALSEFLRANPKWPLRTIQRAMRNRYYSVGINRGEAAWAWLKYVSRYVGDPLDSFKQPMRGKGDQVFAFWENEIKEQAADNADQRG